jgi:Uma2 family endonuclease
MSKFENTVFEDPELQYLRSQKRMTLEDYLEIISDNKSRVEYHDGIVWNIKSQTIAHGSICSNITGNIERFFWDKDFKIFANCRELWVEDCHEMYFPDHIIIEGKHVTKQMSNKIKATINPKVVVEVLSDLTEYHDLNTKMKGYKTIESLNQIIYVSQYEKHVKTHIRFKDENVWKETEYTEDEDVISICGYELKLKEIYDDVVFKMRINS